MFENYMNHISLLGFGMPGPVELMIIMAIFLLIFGGAKLPALMRNMGRSVNEFKTGIKEDPMERDRKIEDASDDDGI